MEAEDVVSMKRYEKRKVQRLGRENQVLQERALFQQLRPSPFVPHLLATPIDSDSVALVLNCVLAGPLELLLRSPLDERSARFIIANVVLALELLHKVHHCSFDEMFRVSWFSHQVLSMLDLMRCLGFRV